MVQEIEIDIDESEFIPDLLWINEDISPILLLCGNRGSGKSQSVYRKHILKCMYQDYYRCIYSRKVAKTIRESIFKGLKEVITHWGFDNYFDIKEGTMTITCTLNGNSMIALGMDEPEKTKAIIDPTDILCDELTEYTFKDFAFLYGLLRTSKTKHLQFIGLFNPEFNFWGRNFFFADPESDIIPEGFVKTKSKDVTIFKADFHKNPFIDAVQYEKQLMLSAEGDENYKTVWIDGNWGQSQTGNEFYPAFKPSIHVGDVPFLKYKPIHLAFDFNVLPFMTLLACQIEITDTEFRFRFFREYCMKPPMNSTEACCNAFLEEYDDDITTLFYYGDASGQNRIVGKGSQTAYTDAEMNLSYFLEDGSKRVLKKNPPVLRARTFINAILSGLKQIEGKRIVMMFDKKMINTIEDYRKTKLGADGMDKERKMNKETGLSYEHRGHCIDASKYLVIKVLYDLFKSLTN